MLNHDLVVWVALWFLYHFVCPDHIPTISKSAAKNAEIAVFYCFSDFFVPLYTVCIGLMPVGMFVTLISVMPDFLSVPVSGLPKRSGFDKKQKRTS